MSYIGNTAQSQSFTPAIDYFNGTGSQTAFTLSRNVASAAQIVVFIENVPQNPASAFTVLNNTLTFTSAPPSGTSNIWVEYTATNVTAVAPSDGTVGTLALATGAVTPVKLSQPMTLATAQNSTSGTSIDFTGIPSWVKRITVMFNGVSTSGTSIIQIQLGYSGGVENTGYIGNSSALAAASSATSALTSGIPVNTISVAAATYNGAFTINLLGSNIWAAFGVVGRSDSAFNYVSSATKTTTGTLDRVRITTVNGTDTFDAGSINILYEG